MADRWLQLRQEYAASLKQHADQTERLADALAWERYTRKTAQMQSVAEVLDQGLPMEYRALHGVQVRHRGRTIYLEHVVTGPTGIFLIETLEQESAAWREDLAQNLDFVREVLGSARYKFACLVIQREPLQVSLPPGAHLIDSPAVALEVIKSPGDADPLVVQNFWRVLDALRVEESFTPPAPPRGWKVIKYHALITGLFILLTSLLFLFDSGQGLGEFLISLFILGIPAGLLLWLLSLLPWRRVRTACLNVVTVATALFFLILLLGSLVSE